MSLVHRLRGAQQRMRSRGESGVASELRFWDEYLAASLLGAGAENGWFELVAADPLATEYAAMMQRHGLAYPVRPVAGHGESLLDAFAERSYTLVFEVRG